jgi:hypothetical protein
MRSAGDVVVRGQEASGARVRPKICGVCDTLFPTCTPPWQSRVLQNQIGTQQVKRRGLLTANAHSCAPKAIQSSHYDFVPSQRTSCLPLLASPRNLVKVVVAPPRKYVRLARSLVDAHEDVRCDGVRCVPHNLG